MREPLPIGIVRPAEGEVVNIGLDAGQATVVDGRARVFGAEDQRQGGGAGHDTGDAGGQAGRDDVDGSIDRGQGEIGAVDRATDRDLVGDGVICTDQEGRDRGFEPCTASDIGAQDGTVPG